MPIAKEKEKIGVCKQGVGDKLIIPNFSSDFL